MVVKQVILGAVAYILATFPLAAIWHIVIFADQYRAFGYFEGEPNLLLGFSSIVVQGVVLSVLFQFTCFKGSVLIQSLKYVALVGVFFWSSHVVAFLAKQSIGNPAGFALMESAYLFIQFGVFGALLGLINKNRQGNT